MVLTDSSVWIDHLRFAEPQLERLLRTGEVLGHPLVTGEVAMGSVSNRLQLLKELDRLPLAIIGRDEEVRRLVETHKLFGRGIGYVDAHLLVAVRLTPEARLWTRDKRLHEVASELGLAFQETRPN
jgi:predicted nucleic acid-binding protein